MHFLVTYLLAGAALAVLFFGPLVLLPLVGLVVMEYGHGAGLLTLGSVLLLCAAGMRGLARWVDARTGEAAEGGLRAAPDRVFCLRCGAASSPDGVVCARCGGTRFGFAAPPMASGTGAPPPAPGLGGLVAHLGQARSAAGRLLAAGGALAGRRPRTVYVQVVRGRCDPARLPALRRLADDRLVPSLRQRPGLLGWYGGGDPTAGTLLSVSLWESAAAARAAAAAPAAAEAPGDRTTFEALGARFDPPEGFEAVLRS